jgi:hypothetical protein
LSTSFSHRHSQLIFATFWFTCYQRLGNNLVFQSFDFESTWLRIDRLNLWRHRQFITIFYQFLHIRIEIIHGSHMYILFLPRVGLMSTFCPSLTLGVKEYLIKDISRNASCALNQISTLLLYYIIRLDWTCIARVHWHNT